MKRAFFIMFLLILAGSVATAQKLAIGEKAPEIKTSRWLDGQPSAGKPTLLEFFHSSSQQSVSRLSELNSLAGEYSGKLNVVVICREPEEKIRAVTGTSAKYYTALDDSGKTFSGFSVQYVPYSVLMDARGRVIWFGNSSSLDEQTLKKAIR